MNFVMKHVPGAGSIGNPGDQQSSEPQMPPWDLEDTEESDLDLGENYINE